MRIDLKQLKQCDVETVSGERLGHVHDLVFEIEGQLVAQYIIKSSLLSSREYRVSRDQIVRFEEKKIIVDDSVATILSTQDATPLPRRAEPAAMRKTFFSES